MTRARSTAEIVTALAAKGFRNYVVDGGCQAARGAAVDISTSAQFGKLDMFAGFAGGTVGAGTVTHATAAGVGRTGNALHLSGVTLTGSGIAKARHRIEAAEAAQLKNATASFAVSVLHDVGSAVDYTIVIRKADAADNFSAVTAIDTGDAVSVESGTATRIAVEGVAMGDCANGIEIEVQAACGAVTTKNFHFTEWQLEESATATAFRRLSYADEIARVNRHVRIYKPGASSEVVSAMVEESATTAAGLILLHPGMRAVPTVTASNLGVGDYEMGYTATLGARVLGNIDGSHYGLTLSANGNAGAVGELQVSSGGAMTIDARL